VIVTSSPSSGRPTAGTAVFIVFTISIREKIREGCYWRGNYDTDPQLRAEFFGLCGRRA